MDTGESGKKKIEEFITEQMRSLNLDSGSYSLLWWSADTLETNRGGMQEATVPLRMYRGNDWRPIKFSQSDVDHCTESPELLHKYEAEIKEALADL